MAQDKHHQNSSIFIYIPKANTSEQNAAKQQQTSSEPSTKSQQNLTNTTQNPIKKQNQNH